jgi:DNA-binding CsgD family transcriptional regulator
VTGGGAPAPDLFAPAVAALGTAAFAAELLAALNRVVPIDHLSLMRFEDRDRAPVLESAVWRGGEHVAEVQRAYLDGLYRRDPNLKITGSGPSIRRLHRDSIPDSDYRAVCYVRPALLERITIAMPEGERLIALNLYRRAATGELSASEFQHLESLSRLLGALAAKHVGTLGMLLRSRDRADRVAALAARLHALDGRLTRRELDVLARILIGMTSEGIALDLGVSTNTVLTYRKRAYGRLGVSSQAELFALCLG